MIYDNTTRTNKLNTKTTQRRDPLINITRRSRPETQPNYEEDCQKHLKLREVSKFGSVLTVH